MVLKIRAGSILRAGSIVNKVIQSAGTRTIRILTTTGSNRSARSIEFSTVYYFPNLLISEKVIHSVYQVSNL